MQKIRKITATLFYIGYVPFAPGTVASLAALPIYYLARNNTPLHLALAGAFLAIGFWSSQKAKAIFGEDDPPQIVIDEFASMFLVYLFIPFNVRFLVIGFVLFRLFDILKLPPLKRLERLPGGFGIMLDDIACAVYTNIILQVLNYSFL